jgi:hypothetical protein
VKAEFDISILLEARVPDERSEQDTDLVAISPFNAVAQPIQNIKRSLQSKYCDFRSKPPPTHRSTYTSLGNIMGFLGFLGALSRHGAAVDLNNVADRISLSDNSNISVLDTMRSALPRASSQGTDIM